MNSDTGGQMTSELENRGFIETFERLYTNFMGTYEAFTPYFIPHFFKMRNFPKNGYHPSPHLQIKSETF